MAAACACCGVLQLCLLLLLLPLVSSISEVTDQDVRSDWELLALYRRWLSLYRPSEVVPASPETAQPPRRFHVFKENARYIHRANRRRNLSYELGLNKFADLTNEEFRATYTTRPPVAKRRPERRRDFARGDGATPLPASADWREKGAVTGVKDQGACGSCWAFSTVAAVEGINQIRTGELVSLSEQELVDCDKVVNEGCNGGFMDDAFKFIVAKGGISSEEEYPYTATDDGRCNITKGYMLRGHNILLIYHVATLQNSHVVSIDGYEDVPAGDGVALLNAVSRQPVSVAIDASSIEFQFYWRGVFNGVCGTSLNHGVAVVGYGEMYYGTKYWVVKNSWGSDWGEEGYIRMERREGDGLCGINLLASYPIKVSPANPSSSSPPPSWSRSSSR
ncbi:hypothetical protein Taro_009661 [Colocasia esculenta]|uniref:Uncharacterized protein n=1 Tax=Colocasia esculenta TaxID=4460 RepID=A0A843U4N0_COLES|nr:hypothetical protein [Colocasia esculenta]